ncbi:hypothetical protein WJX73_005973 [Symbiochloris irregularis]|uniref:Electron transfer flavoprotein subunit alpha n=1 Tax=Symbiochloris irregularis TaxID=706552 RepID=A0AAW1PCL8_9CHLO
MQGLRRSLSRRSWLPSRVGSRARQISTLVVAEFKDSVLSGATLNTVGAASELGGEVTVLVAGSKVAPVSNLVRCIEGVAKVLVADDPCLAHQLAEHLTPLIVAIQQQRNFTHVLAPSTSFGRNFLPRAAAVLDVQPVSDVIRILDSQTYVRPIYAGNALQTVRANTGLLQMMTVRTTAFPAALVGSDGSAAIESVTHTELAAAQEADAKVTWVSEELQQSERPELSAARVVVSGGRALKSKENFAMLEQLADDLGGAVGASRAAVDAGYVPNDMQVGQTGKVVAPDLYIAVGISGAIQHLSGMKDSKCIVAINKDADAPIFQVADYGLCGDLFETIPALRKEIAKHKT